MINRTEEANVGSEQGRNRSNECLKTLVPVRSVKATVHIKNSIHHELFFLKFRATNTKRNRYRGIQILDCRKNGNTASKREFVHCPLTF